MARLIHACSAQHIANVELSPDDAGTVQWVLSHTPTVDAVEVVHSHWCWDGRFRACAKCGSYVELTETLGASFWKFCPFCGAKMDGGTEYV